MFPLVSLPLFFFLCLCFFLSLSLSVCVPLTLSMFVFLSISLLVSLLSLSHSLSFFLLSLSLSPLHKNGNDKHTSLLCYGINDDSEKFYNTCPAVDVVKKFILSKAILPYSNKRGMAWACPSGESLMLHAYKYHTKTPLVSQVIFCIIWWSYELTHFTCKTDKD